MMVAGDGCCLCLGNELCVSVCCFFLLFSSSLQEIRTLSDAGERKNFTPVSRGQRYIYLGFFLFLPLLLFLLPAGFAEYLFFSFLRSVCESSALVCRLVRAFLEMDLPRQQKRLGDTMLGGIRQRSNEMRCKYQTTDGYDELIRKNSTEPAQTIPFRIRQE